MNAILKQLTNPEWWFSVVVMGLVVGIAGTYLKDGLTKVLSSLSIRMRKHFEERRKFNEKRATRMIETPQLLVIEYLRTTLNLASSLILIFSSFILPAWHVLQELFPHVDPVTSILGLPQISSQINQFLSLLLGLFGLFLWSTGLQKLKFCALVRHRLENTCNHSGAGSNQALKPTRLRRSA